jgi:molecular chaperone DnaK
MILVDITPLSLGISIIGGVFSPIIPRNTAIPVKKSKVFTSTHDGQTEMGIPVYQGERPLVEDNKLLGSFVLKGLPPAPRGAHKVEVIFDIDTNGIVTVTARDQATGRGQHIQLKSSGGLSDSEIESMIKKAEKHASADKARKETIEDKNRAEQAIYATKKSLSAHKDQLSPAQCIEVETAIHQCEEALSGTNDEIRAKTAALEKAAMKIGEAVYNRSSSKSN